MTTLNIDKLTGKALKTVGAWQTGHFLLTSGKHSDQYMQCQKVMQYPRFGNLLADLLIEKLASDSIVPDVVVGPALGAIHWEVFVAQALDRFKMKAAEREINNTTSSAQKLDKLADQETASIESEFVKAIFAEKVSSADGAVKFEIRRGVDIKKSQKVLVVEDVTTTGGSARKVVELIKSMNLEPVAVGCVVDRSGGEAKFDVPFVSLLSLNLQTYDPDKCPLCDSGSKAIKPGSSIS